MLITYLWMYIVIVPEHSLTEPSIAVYLVLFNVTITELSQNLSCF